MCSFYLSKRGKNPSSLCKQWTCAPDNAVVGMPLGTSLRLKSQSQKLIADSLFQLKWINDPRNPACRPAAVQLFCDW